MSREGSGRVGIHRATKTPHSYTLECHYSCGLRLNTLDPMTDAKTGDVVVDSEKIRDAKSDYYPNSKAPVFNIEMFEDVGRGVCLGFLDFIGENPLSRLP